MSWEEEKKIEALQEIARGLSGVERALRDARFASPLGTDIWERLRGEVAVNDDEEEEYDDPPVELDRNRAADMLYEHGAWWVRMTRDMAQDVIDGLAEKGYVLCQIPVDDDA